jgi:hypothetical protein
MQMMEQHQVHVSQSNYGQIEAEPAVLTIQTRTDALVHASHCDKLNCRRPLCQMMINTFQHVSTCTLPIENKCYTCNLLFAVCCNHALQCKHTNCTILLCEFFKLNFRFLEQNNAKNHATHAGSFVAKKSPRHFLPEAAVTILKEFFASNQYPTKQERLSLTKPTGLTELQIKNWCKNKRKTLKKVI